MKVIDLYKYTREDGGVTVSPEKPEDKDYTLQYRLVADHNKILTDEIRQVSVIDIEVENLSNWREINL